MLISPAYAQAPGGVAGFDIMTIVPLILIFVVFYFLLIRPQQKKVKEHRSMLSTLRRGDKVVTNGGIIGRITRVVSDNELQLEIAEGVRVQVARSMISSVYVRGDADEEEEEPRKGRNDRKSANDK
ncbi:MAG TPA: preprotein translocase subunit YajC [Alphaproteobacteria bacterium]|jgi:preprotein translocase subunit YajC